MEREMEDSGKFLDSGLCAEVGGVEAVSGVLLAGLGASSG